MRLYACQYCSLTLYFENTLCTRCHSVLGYHAETDSLCVIDRVAGDAAGDDAFGRGTWTSWSVPGRRLKRCFNHRFGACNWLVDEAQVFCTACRHNRVVPAPDSPAGLAGWRKLEAAKHRLFASLHRLGLVRVIDRAGVASLGFLFLEDPPGGPPILTGHAFGLITVAVTEADDAQREQRRLALGEPYRTLLGHFRHESAHYFWDRLVRDRGREDECRAVFGDHAADYPAAVQRYYAAGAPHDWQKHFVSAYATMHPWEDFAESWAHYLHMMSTLDTAQAYRLQIAPLADRFGVLRIAPFDEPLASTDFEAMVAVWMPLTILMNSLNEALGREHAYPFALTAPVIAKLGYVHRLIREAVGEATADDLAETLRVVADRT